MDYSGFYVDENGVANWFDASGNLVASQEPGGAIVFYADDQAPAGSYQLNQTQLQAGAAASDWGQILQVFGGAISAWQLNQINLERARQGKAPINAAAYGPQVGVGLNADTKQLITWIAVGAAALFLFARKRG